MSRNIIITEGELYHIYNRGTEKRKTFMGTADYERFLTLLHFCNGTASVRIDDLPRGRTLREMWKMFEPGEPLVDICAYCLMPNHFHLLIREKTEDGISRFMQKLLTAYTMYFNTRNSRTGALFQGKYKASHINDDRYLKYLLSYVHLNPVKLIEPKWKETGISGRAKAEKFLDNYRFSSFPDYCGKKRVEQKILNMEALKEYYDCAAPTDFRGYVREWLNLAPRE